MVDPVTGVAPPPIDLNSHINYNLTPGPPAEIAASLAHPVTGVFNGSGSTYYVAGIGSKKVGVVDTGTGAVDDLIDVGDGPSGLALNEADSRLYVLNRFDNTISTVNTATNSETRPRIGVAGPAQFDPSPDVIKIGRKFLYDGQLTSGHGDTACATCHVFGNFDNLAWELGDPQGDFVDYDDAPWVTFAPLGPSTDGFDPQKGPMTTQTLRGLQGMEPFHWRGDRQNFQHFNHAFIALMGRASEIPTGGHGRLHRLHHDGEVPAQPVPQPRQHHAEPPSGARRRPAAARRRTATPTPARRCSPTTTSMAAPSPATPATCCRPARPTTCSTATLEGESQDFKIPHLRNMYEKVGFDVIRPNLPSGDANNIGLTDQKRGFGFIHDGAVSLTEFLAASVFTSTTQQERDLFAFMLAFPTETVPAVGRQQTVTSANKNNAARDLDDQHADRAGRDGELRRHRQGQSSAAWPRASSTIAPATTSCPTVSPKAPLTEATLRGSVQARRRDHLHRRAARRRRAPGHRSRSRHLARSRRGHARLRSRRIRTATRGSSHRNCTTRVASAPPASPPSLLLLVAALASGGSRTVCRSTRRAQFMNAPIEVGEQPPPPPAAPAGRAEVERRFAAARADFAAGRYAEAAEGFAFVVAQDPSGPARRTRRSGTSPAAGCAAATAAARWRRSTACCATTPTTSGSEAPDLRDGLERMQAGDLAGAQAAYERMIEAQPDSEFVPLAWALIARIHWTHGEPMETVRAFARMFAVGARPVPAYGTLAKQLERYAGGDTVGDDDASRSMARQGPEGFRDIYQYLAARTLLEQDQFEATQQSLERLRRELSGRRLHPHRRPRAGLEPAAPPAARPRRWRSSSGSSRASRRPTSTPSTPSSTCAPSCPMGIARCQLALGHYQEAVAAFERAISDDGDEHLRGRGPPRPRQRLRGPRPVRQGGRRAARDHRRASRRAQALGPRAAARPHRAPRAGAVGRHAVSGSRVVRLHSSLGRGQSQTVGCGHPIRETAVTSRCARTRKIALAKRPPARRRVDAEEAAVCMWLRGVGGGGGGDARSACGSQSPAGAERRMGLSDRQADRRRRAARARPRHLPRPARRRLRRAGVLALPARVASALSRLACPGAASRRRGAAATATTTSCAPRRIASASRPASSARFCTSRPSAGATPAAHVVFTRLARLAMANDPANLRDNLRRHTEGRAARGTSRRSSGACASALASSKASSIPKCWRSSRSPIRPASIRWPSAAPAPAPSACRSSCPRATCASRSTATATDA